MGAVTNISTGPRGAWLKGVLIMAEAGQTIEADDFVEEWFKASGDTVATATGDEIASAVALLDHANDEHWTKAGLPAVEAVEAILGVEIKRADIEAAAPGVERKKAD